ncbi:sodium-coupled monocarboxylate transporter 1-like [Ischnura elegans]|uniref:sodium-coupled monocarboxylate transporter 1-like n=1 Tax=Ischnura elegans TaxID=197161 RepID=UPI001ED89372|nr:sodium-coupled monocarboxylate transporter 1-like [Ischnura elegans]
METVAAESTVTTPWATSYGTDGMVISKEGLAPKVHVLSVLDHTLFTGMLVISAVIGIYFAFFAKQKQNTTSEYLMGGKNMGIIPVSLSLISSFISGITLLGVPAEVYVYGTQFATMLLGIVGATLGCGLFFMPVFYGLQLTTSYEYLEVRFNRKVRILGSFLFLMNNLLYIPIVMYVPALALNQVTGVNLHLITPLVSLVCIFYTSLGGLKAVVWTDALQTAMMFLSTGTVVVLGTHAVGGLSTVWKRSEDSGRIEFFNMDPDPTIRHTFWNTSFGVVFNWMANISVNQGMVQRFLAMHTLKRAHILLVIFTFGGMLITGLSCYCGLLIYATYYDCDRLSAKVVRASDQLMPYFVMDVAGWLSGLPGLFIAGVFSAALSTMSTGLNSMSGVIFEDFINPFLKVKVSDERASFIMKIICALFGVFCVCMVFIVEHLGAIVQLNWSLIGITSGPMLAIFALGMFFPWVNSKGAFVGGAVGLIIMGFISFGAQWAVATGQIRFEKKPVSTDGCLFPSHFSTSSGYETAIINETAFGTDFTTDATTFSQPETNEAWFIFRISYTLYSFVGLVISVVVGLIVSFLTGPTDPADVHIDLLTPVVRPLFAHRCKSGDDGAYWRQEETEPEQELNQLKGELEDDDNPLKEETITLMLQDAENGKKPSR